ncbi:hypothetical protein [Rossellomorea marisflavi]|uniref:hypothetical protein n=1 Tax=Rossellomorea marisflavi TaxID=189381 RepID=UPI003F9FE55C
MITNLVLIYALINLFGILYLLHKIDEIMEYSFRDDGIKIKYILVGTLLFPACLFIGIVALIFMGAYEIIFTEWFEKLKNNLNKRIL